MKVSFCQFNVFYLKSDKARENGRSCRVPVAEDAGEAGCCALILHVLLALFRFNLNSDVHADGRLGCKARVHFIHAEALQGSLALLNAGHRLYVSPQFHLRSHIRKTCERPNTGRFYDYSLAEILYQSRAAVSAHLGDVMGAKHVNQVVILLLALRAVGFGEIIYCSEELLGQLGRAGQSVPVCKETSQECKGCTELAERPGSALIPFRIILPVVLAVHALTREGQLVVLGLFH